ncbi:MAG: hypothetical protein IKW32_05215, partial [Bacteroidaceae bacterium]|nr:hypothetical protein [Bacteroidaceae bacterium]
FIDGFCFLTYVRIVLLACSYLNLSKNSSLNTSVSKADAKIRVIFELPKLFEVFFEKSFFQIGKGQILSFVSVFHDHRVSLSKAGAKLLLYNIYSKCLCHIFSTFWSFCS